MMELPNIGACLNDPQVLLGKALNDRNLQNFKHALDMEADPTRMDTTTNQSILETALSTNGCADFVAECLKQKCNLNYTNSYNSKRPINFAVESKDPKILLKILEYGDIDIDYTHYNLTPLNKLAKHITPENSTETFECIKLLLDHKADPNIPDNTDRTPILYILNNKKIDEEIKRKIVEYFVNNSSVDLDTYRDGEAREKMDRYFPHLNIPQWKGCDHSTLMSFLRNDKEDKFLKEFQIYSHNMTNEKENQQNFMSEHYVSFLAEAIKNGLNKAVDLLIKSGVQVNRIGNGPSPIEIACMYGNWMALEKLLSCDHLKINTSETILKNVIQKLDENSLNNFCDYYKCLETLLNSDKVNPNEADNSGTSALHYAVMYKNERAIEQLLKRGAYIGKLSKFGDLPITDMNPEILENFLDSCITTNNCKPGDPDFEIIFNYTNLIPGRAKSDKQRIQQHVEEEMLPINYMAKTKDLRYLLAHPIITSFLFLKWHRLSFIFYLNFILYSLFCVFLVTYIILNFSNNSNETCVFIFRSLSTIGVIYILIRECIQFFISPKMYFKNVVNYFEILLVILSIITLCNPKYENEEQRVIAVCTILLAAFELCLLVGSLPILSVSTHMLMLQAVSTTFLKSFALYSIFVITFSFCFYILLGRVDPSADNKDGEFNKFVDPFTALIKTIVMLTGEYDAGDIDFQSNFSSYFLFMFFVFFMSIVLFNLLNGLAISDTQAIKSRAELNGYICRTFVLRNYEKVLSSRNKTTGFFITHQPFRSICKNLLNLYPHFIPDKHIITMPNSGNKIFIHVSEEAFSAVPSENIREENAEKGIPLWSCWCPSWVGQCTRMDKRTMKTAINILYKRNKAQRQIDKTTDQEKRLRGIEAKMEQIIDLLSELNQRPK